MNNVRRPDQWPAAILEQVRHLAKQESVTPAQYDELASSLSKLDDIATSPSEVTDALESFVGSQELAKLLERGRNTEAGQREGNGRQGLLAALEGLLAAANRRLATAVLDNPPDMTVADKDALRARRKELIALAQSPDAKVLIHYIRQRVAVPWLAGLPIRTGGWLGSFHLTGTGKIKNSVDCFLQMSSEDTRDISVDKARAHMSELVAQIARGEFPELEISR